MRIKLIDRHKILSTPSAGRTRHRSKGDPMRHNWSRNADFFWVGLALLLTAFGAAMIWHLVDSGTWREVLQLLGNW